ncbi:MAG: hypothetical protein ABI120_14310 [Gemmatimonadaceae bacterium]
MHSRYAQSADQAAQDFADKFAESAAQCQQLTRHADFLMAGSVVRATIVGTELFDAFVRSFSHLQIESDSRGAELHVRLWDVEATGIGDAHNEITYDPSQTGETIASDDGRYVYFGRPQLQTVLDRSGATITGCVGSAARLTLYDVGRPLHSELLLWHHDHGLLPVHAGMVARNDNGVLLAGPGGSGKSTTSVMCHLAGFSYLADDYVAVEWRDDGSVHGHSIYNSTHIDPTHLQRFPQAITSTAVSGTLTREDKSLVMLSQAAAGHFSGEARIRVVGLPRVAHTPHTTVRRASKVEALLRLAPSSLFLMPYAGMGRTGFARLNDLVNSVPAYWVELGEDLQEIPGVIDQLLTDVTAL